MTDHLPECPLLEPCDDDVPEHGYCSMQRGAFCIHCHQWCICDRLRACEQRVREEHATEWQTEQEEIHVLGLNLAYRKGLDAARDAEAALPGSVTLLYRADALAAIDALRAGDHSTPRQPSGYSPTATDNRP